MISWTILRTHFVADASVTSVKYQAQLLRAARCYDALTNHFTEQVDPPFENDRELTTAFTYFDLVTQLGLLKGIPS